jgi:hypothetical protein
VRWLVVAIACVACSSKTAAPVDAYPSNFTFAGDYTLEPNITSMTLGSATVVGGQTLHVERTYDSYAAAQGDYEFAEVSAYGITLMMAVGPFCDVQQCPGTPYNDIETDTVEWASGSNSYWVQGEYTCYTTAGEGCGATVN